MFPDAPTERGIKHLNELVDAKMNGYDAYVFFVAQMKDCEYFTPNVETHPQFATALKNAQEQGVEVRCVNCNVAEGIITVDDFVEVAL